MATVKINVEYIAQNPNSVINSVACPTANNTSSNNVLVPSTNPKPFVWGASKWGQGQKFISKYNGFASRQCSDASGNFAIPVTLTVSGTVIETLRIKFSESLNQWAILISIDGGVAVVNDSLNFTATGLTGNSHTIAILKWSEPLFNARIDSISMSYVIEYTNRQIMTLISGNYSTADEDEPAYGLISQYGSFRIKDINGEIKNIAEQQLLSENSPITISFNGETQNVLKSNEWKYRVNEISTDFKDDILAWQGMDCPERLISENATFLQLFNEVNIIFSVDDETTLLLQNIRITNPYYAGSNLWDILYNLCNAAQLRLWQDKGGNYNIELRN